MRHDRSSFSRARTDKRLFPGYSQPQGARHSSVTLVFVTLPNSLDLSPLFSADPGKGGRGYLLPADSHRPVSRSRTASDSTCPRSSAILAPSGENRNLRIRSAAKCVSWRAGELSSGCSHKLSTPFSRTTYTTALGSDMKVSGDEA